MNTQQLWLIAGLGNPGRQYEGHRHNIGFMAVDRLVEAYRLTPNGAKFHAECWRGKIDGKDMLALKPQTYMNRSGIAAGEAARFFKIPPEQVIVIHDELDLLPGKLKVKIGGGHGGHNGLKDIDRALGQNYWRVRLGIGHPGRKEMVHSHVLSDFSKEEWALEEPLLDATVRHFPHLLAGAPDKLMNAVALQLNDKP